MTEPVVRPEWDQLSIETPELVMLEMPVAGLGSRFAALAVDYLIWIATIVIIVIITALVDPSLGSFHKLGAKWATALEFFIPFLLMWGYFTLFEAFWDGRTPGKRVARIRVIQRTGRGIGLFESMTRNLVRIVDQFPFIYVVGTISILVTREHQRLGDLAAGTLVIHDRQTSLDLSSSSTSIGDGRTFTSGIFANSIAQIPSMREPSEITSSVAFEKISALGASDLELLETFFSRRLDFTLDVRAALAAKLAAGIQLRTGLAIPDGMSVESYLETVARQLRDLRRLG